ncbi:MAG: PDZ domain-containing protein [Myxococcaceae bacterium]|nr:PDZ domain-containing protein [Myxococcaceae bacterium]
MRLRTSLLLHVGPLALLAIVAVLVTLPFTTWLEAELAPPIITSAPALSGAGREVAPPLDAPRLHALLGLSTTPRPGPIVLASRVPFAGRLLGTLSARAREESMASFVLPTGETDTVWEGDQVADAEVVSIERGAVVLLRNGSLERVALRPTGPVTPIPAIQAVSAHDYRVSRTEVLRRMSDLYALSREVRIVPAFRDGLPIGFRFAGIAADSPVAQLGLQSGDVIRAVNGQPMQSVQQVLALAASLERAGEVRIELERSGQPLTHRYQLD